MKTWAGFEAPLDERHGTVTLPDMVVHLGRTRRFGGYGSPEWTVLHHSMLVSLLWLRAGYPRELLHLPLLHDAHEYATGDIPKPIKKALLAALPKGSFDPIKVVEKTVDARIDERLGIFRNPTPFVEHWIKVCDLAALVIEAALFGPSAGMNVRRTDVSGEFDVEVADLVAKAVPELEQIVKNRKEAPR